MQETYSPYVDEENDFDDEYHEFSSLDCIEEEHLENFQELIKKYKRIPHIFHSSNKAAEVLRNHQKHYEALEHTIPIDVVTRWNSTYKMMYRVLENINFINEALRDRSLNKKFERFILTETEMNDLKDAVQILHCFDYATTVLSDTH